jgi:ketosteroid isomerase-like protein
VTVAGALADNKRLVERFFATLGALDSDEWIKLWHPDGVFEQPYALEGYPARLEGIEAIYGHVKSIDEIFADFSFHDLEVRATDDPQVLVATLRSESRIVATGRRYANDYVALFRIRDARVVLYREYFNPLMVLDAFGDAATLRAVFDIDE